MAAPGLLRSGRQSVLGQRRERKGPGPGRSGLFSPFTCCAFPPAGSEDTTVLPGSSDLHSLLCRRAGRSGQGLWSCREDKFSPHWQPLDVPSWMPKPPHLLLRASQVKCKRRKRGEEEKKGRKRKRRTNYRDITSGELPARGASSCRPGTVCPSVQDNGNLLVMRPRRPTVAASALPSASADRTGGGRTAAPVAALGGETEMREGEAEAGRSRAPTLALSSGLSTAPEVRRPGLLIHSCL